VSTRADVFVPPIPGVDFFYLGSPWGPLVGVGVVAATVAAFVLLRRRKVHGCLAAIAALLIFLVGDCTSYIVGFGRWSREKRERRLEREERREREEREERAHPPEPPSAASSR
jgi:hypothetical protein